MTCLLNTMSVSVVSNGAGRKTTPSFRLRNIVRPPVDSACVGRYNDIRQTFGENSRSNSGWHSCFSPHFANSIDLL